MSDSRSNDRHANPSAAWPPPPAPPAASPLTPTPRSSRRRVAAVAAVSALTGALVMVAVDRTGGSHDPVASAAPVAEPTPTTPPSTEAPSTEAPSTDEGTGDVSDLVRCLEDALGVHLDPSTGMPDLHDLEGLDPSALQDALDACGDQIDEALGSIPGLDQVVGSLPPLGDLTRCIADHAGDLRDQAADLVPADGAVIVVGPDGPTVLEFGDGDGSVTVRRQDGEITVEQDGDVTTLDPSDPGADSSQLDDALDELIDRAVADLEACGVQVPGD